MKQIILKISMLLVFAVALISCEDETDYIVTLNEAGDLKVKVTDLEGNALSQVTVNLKKYDDTDGSYYFLTQDSTDNAGYCDFGEILQGRYMINYVAEKEDMYYGEETYFQVIAGKQTEQEVTPFDNKGTLTINLVDYDGNPIEGLNVALIPFVYDSYNEDHESLLDAAYGLLVSDSEGSVTFEDVPVQSWYKYYYDLYIYDSENTYDAYYSSSLDKDEHQVRQVILNYYNNK